MSGLIHGLFVSVPPYHGKHCVHPAAWSYPSNLMTLVVSDNLQDNKVSHLEKEYIVDLSCGPPSYSNTVIQSQEEIKTEDITEEIKEKVDDDECTQKIPADTINIASIPENPEEQQLTCSPLQEVTIIPELQICPMQDRIPEIIEEKLPSPSDNFEKQLKSLVKIDEELIDEIHNNVTASASPEIPQNAKLDVESEMSEGVSSHLLFEHLGLIHAECPEIEPSLIPPISEEYLGKYPLLKATDSLLLLTQGGQTEVYWNEPSESDTDSMSTPTDSPSHRPTPRPITSPILFKSGSSFGLHSPDNLPAGYLPSETEMQQLAQQLGLQDSQLPFSFAEGTLYLDPDIIDLTMIPPPITPDQEKTVDFLIPISTPPTPFADKETVELFNDIAESMKDIVVPPNEPDQSPSLQGKKIGQQLKSKPSVWTGSTESPQFPTYLLYNLEYDSDSGNETISSENIEMSSQETTHDVLESLSSLDLSQYLSPDVFPMDGQFGIVPDTQDIDSFIARVTVPPPPLQTPVQLSRGVPSSLSDDIDYFIIPPPPSLDSSPIMDSCLDLSLSVTSIGSLKTEEKSELENTIDSDKEPSLKNDEMVPGNASFSPDNSTVLYFEPGTHMTQSTTESDTEDTPSKPKHSIKEKIPFISHSFDNGSSSPTHFKCERSSSYHDLPSTAAQPKNLGFRSPALSHKISQFEQKKTPVSQSPSEMKTFKPTIYTQPQNSSSLGLNRLKKSPQGLPKKIPLSSQPIQRISKVQVNGDSEHHNKGLKVSPPHQRPGLLGTKIKVPNLLQEKDINSSPKSTKLVHPFKGSQDTPSHDIPCKGNTKESLKPSKISRIPSSHLMNSNGNGDHSSKKYNGPYMSKKSNSNQSLKSNSPSPPEKLFPFSVKKSAESQSCSLSSFDHKNGSSDIKFNISPKSVSKFSINMNQTEASSSSSSRFDDPYEKCEFSTFKVNHSPQNKKQSPPSSSAGLSKLPVMKSKSQTVVPENLRLGSPSKTQTSNPDLNRHLAEMEVEPLLPEPDYPTDGDEELQLAQNQISSIIRQMDTVLETLKSFTTETNIEKFLVAKEILVTESRQFVTASKLFVKSATETHEKVVHNLKHCVGMLRCICETAFTVAEHSDSVVQAQNLVSKVRDVATTFRNTVHTATKVVGKPLSDPGMKLLMQQATNLATALTALMRTLRVIDVPP